MAFYSPCFVCILFLTATVCSASWLNLFGRNEPRSIDKVPRSSESSGEAAPTLSNFASDKSQRTDSTASPHSINTTIGMDANGAKTTIVHKLLNVPINNGTGAIFLNIDLQKMMADPYVHGVVLPAAIGMIVALLTLLLVCSIRSCIHSQVRKRRKRRIRNLAEELKADQKVLLTADSDDEI